MNPTPDASARGPTRVCGTNRDASCTRRARPPHSQSGTRRRHASLHNEVVGHALRAQQGNRRRTSHYISINPAMYVNPSIHLVVHASFTGESGRTQRLIPSARGDVSSNDMTERTSTYRRTDTLALKVHQDKLASQPVVLHGSEVSHNESTGLV